MTTLQTISQYLHEQGIRNTYSNPLDGFWQSIIITHQSEHLTIRLIDTNLRLNWVGNHTPPTTIDLNNPNSLKQLTKTIKQWKRTPSTH